MGFDLEGTFDSVKEKAEGLFDTAHAETKEFHEKYISDITPDCGKYGDAATFAAELIPGVAEYNAIREGDWKAFAIAAGVDIGAIAAGAFTFGAGYAAVKGGSAVAKAGVKAAVKEVAEVSTKKVTKEVIEKGTEKVTREVVETGTEKATVKASRAGTEKLSREAIETGAERSGNEAVVDGTEKRAKEITETGTEKISKEGTEKLDKPDSKIEQNRIAGKNREIVVADELNSKYGEGNVIREAYIRDSKGTIVKDAETGEARRIDFVVKDGDKIIKSIEVTSETANKVPQMAKEKSIRAQAEETGGAFVKDPMTGKLLSLPKEIVTEIRRLP